MNVRDAIIQRVNQRIMRMRTAFEQFDNEAAERMLVGPKWNVRDLAGHMAHWAGVAAERLRELARGQAVRPFTAAEIDRINDEVYRKNRRMSYVMLLPQLRAAEERLMAVVGAVDPAMLIGETPVREYLGAAILEHYDHHWEGLEKAVARV